MENTTDTIIEGVGDEVVWGILACTSTTVAITFALQFWIFNRTAQQIIHPESQANVEATRDRLRDEHRLGDATTPTDDADEESLCPICFSQRSHAVETNCGHYYCGRCIITHWRYSFRMDEPMKCPVCRQNVNLMLFMFTSEENNTTSADKNDIISTVGLYNRRYSDEPRQFIDQVRDFPMLLRHMVSEFFSPRGLLMMFRLRILFCFLIVFIYFIVPLDLIPEAVFGILGFLDDLLLFLVLTIYLTIAYRSVAAVRLYDDIWDN